MIWSCCGGNDVVSVSFRIALGGDSQTGATGTAKAFADGPFPISLSWKQCSPERLGCRSDYNSEGSWWYNLPIQIAHGFC